MGARGTEALAALESRVRSLSQGRLWMHTDAAEQLPFVAPIDKHVALLHARHEKARPKPRGAATPRRSSISMR